MCEWMLAHALYMCVRQCVRATLFGVLESKEGHIPFVRLSTQLRTLCDQGPTLYQQVNDNSYGHLL